jgi:hypothetical protein
VVHDSSSFFREGCTTPTRVGVSSHHGVGCGTQRGPTLVATMGGAQRYMHRQRPSCDRGRWARRSTTMVSLMVEVSFSTLSDDGGV